LSLLKTPNGWLFSRTVWLGTQVIWEKASFPREKSQTVYVRSQTVSARYPAVMEFQYMLPLPSSFILHTCFLNPSAASLYFQQAMKFCGVMGKPKKIFTRQLFLMRHD
jgi:hypothetical protein